MSSPALSIRTTAILACLILLGISAVQTVAWWYGDQEIDVSTLAVPTHTAADDAAWRDELVRLGIIATSTEADIATSTDPVARIADILGEQAAYGYLSLKEGVLSLEDARAYGSAVGENVLPISTAAHISVADIDSTTDVSKERTLAYRADVRDATGVLITDTEPEVVLFAKYIDSKNPNLLEEIKDAAARYNTAANAMKKILVPHDAKELHVRAVNSLLDYENTLDRLVLYADSPLASLALLRTYNEVEREMLLAFDALADYYVRKVEGN